MVKLLCLCVMACAIVALVTARPPIYPVAMELASKTIQHAQMDWTFVLGYIFQLQDALRAYLTEPQDKNSLDQCLKLIDELKAQLRTYALEYLARVNTDLLQLNRILTEFGIKHPRRSNTHSIELYLYSLISCFSYFHRFIFHVCYTIHR